jgi:HlyD family secretion protein
MKKRNIILIAAAAIVLLVVLYMCSGKKNSSKVTFENTKVTRSDIATSITATGTLEADTVNVGTQVSGQVTKLFVDYNSVVKKGEIIAELDKTTLEADLKSKLASMRSAQSEVRFQSSNYSRYKQLHDKQLVSQSDYDTALDSYNKAKQAYDVSRQDYEKSKTNLGYATIYSPVDGIVLSRSVAVGQTVAATYSTPKLFTIAKNLKDLQVVAKVDEADIGNVMVGQRVSFTVDAFPDDTFEGVVQQVRLNAGASNNVVTYQVIIKSNNEQMKLKPGLTANVTIYTSEKTNVLSVPAKALRFTPDQTLVGKDAKIVDCQAAHKLWTREGNTFTAHAVEIGITNGIRTEILSGVKEGQAFVLDAVAAGGLTNDAQADSSSDSSSPFMPKHPNNNKKSAQKTSATK